MLKPFSRGNISSINWTFDVLWFDYPLAEVDAPDGGDGDAQEDDDDALDADLHNGNSNDAYLQSGQN